MVGFEFDENPLIADRIQLSVNIPYVIYENEIDKYSYISSVFKAYLSDKLEYNVLYDRIKKQYYIGVDDDLYQSEFPFCSHSTLRMDLPYTVTTEFNFTRLIRSFAVMDPSFNKDMDKSIRVADDNYINKRIWSNWNNNTIKSLAENIPKYAFTFAKKIINEYIPDFDLKYNVLTIKQIEFNKDYYVGHHKSSDVLHQLMYYVISASGVEWINKLSGYGLSVYNTEKNESENLRFYGDLYNPTLKFPIGKGIYFKIYRKTTDDIRFEITFQKQFIIKELKKQGFNFVYPHLRKIAKEFFRKAEFKEILQSAVDNSYSDNFSIIDNMYKFLDLSYPEISSIVDSVTFGNPISDIETINFIKGNKRIRHLFERKYLPNGKKIYVYKPKIKKTDKKTLFKKPSLELLELYKSYKKNYPFDKIFMGWDGKTLIHRG